MAKEQTVTCIGSILVVIYSIAILVIIIMGYIVYYKL